MTHDTAPNDGGFDRLYTPWRMNYVKRERRDPDCVFCSMRDAEDDAGNLILTRSEHGYVVLNLFPYNTGHLLIVPNLHVASPEDLPREALHDLADLLPRSLTAARLAFGPDAFNVGYNLGVDAGAGIAAHLHQHIVPRWRGDANFMPIVGGTKVLPEVLPVSWSKLRAEFLRDSAESFELLVIDRLRARILTDPGNRRLPRIIPEPSVPVWKSAVDRSASAGAHARLTSVASDRAGHTLVLEADSVTPDCDASAWIPLHAARGILPPAIDQFLERPRAM